MPENFFTTRLPEIQPCLETWWNHGDQKNPCLVIILPPPKGAGIPMATTLEQWWLDIDFIIERQMKVIDYQRYFGQAVPYHFVDRSASAMSGVLGARMQMIDQQTLWAYPCFDSVEQVAEVVLDRGNPWYQTACRITRRSVALAGGHHYVSVWPLEGVSDILPGLYGTENFLVDLIHKPQEVARAMEQVKRLWIELFYEFSEMIAGSGNRGGIGWAGIWAPGTTFPLQEDVSYMISKDMYRKFCLPHLLDFIDAMEYAFYHLDGIGAIKHLDTLLAIPKLRVIQWVPGAGKERLSDWYELIRKILAAEKSIQVFAKPWEVDDLVKNVGARGLLITLDATEEEALWLVDKYGSA
jgi:hypothetical protein